MTNVEYPEKLSVSQRLSILSLPTKDEIISLISLEPKRSINL